MSNFIHPIAIFLLQCSDAKIQLEPDLHLLCPSYQRPNTRGTKTLGDLVFYFFLSAIDSHYWKLEFSWTALTGLCNSFTSDRLCYSLYLPMRFLIATLSWFKLGGVPPLPIVSVFLKYTTWPIHLEIKISFASLFEINMTMIKMKLSFISCYICKNKQYIKQVLPLTKTVCSKFRFRKN